MGQDEDWDAQTTRITARYSQYSLHTSVKGRK